MNKRGIATSTIIILGILFFGTAVLTGYTIGNYKTNNYVAELESKITELQSSTEANTQEFQYLAVKVEENDVLKQLYLNASQTNAELNVSLDTFKKDVNENYRKRGGGSVFIPTSPIS